MENNINKCGKCDQQMSAPARGGVSSLPTHIHKLCLGEQCKRKLADDENPESNIVDNFLTNTPLAETSVPEF